MARKGMMIGSGKGYKNVMGKDPKVHSESAKGIKQPEKVYVPQRIVPENPDRYNGWTNRETWAVKLWWDNSSGDQEYFWGEAKRFRKEKKPAYEFADFLKEQYEEMEDSVYNGEGNEDAKSMVKDVGSSWRVDWREIAESYYSDVAEDEKYRKENK